jgi:hypothetical protein
MKKRTAINRYSWSQGLREYDPGEKGYPNKEEGWKRLRARMDNQPKRKRIAWYWIAAASVVLFFAIRLFFAGGNHQAVSPELTGKPTVFKENKKTVIPIDTATTGASALVRSPHSKTTTKTSATNDSLQLTAAQKDSSQPVPRDSVYNAINDTPLVIQDIAHEAGRLPTVHINDITTKEPLPPNISIKSLGVQKLIRLFGIDMTSGQPLKSQQKIPGIQQTIPDNQN